MKIFKSEFFINSRFHWDFIKKIENMESWDLLSKQYDESKEKNYKPIVIPKIFHQIWLGPKKLPRKYKLWMKSWLKYNPDYDYILWRDNDIKNLKMINREIFFNTTNIAIKSDIARYEILKKYGGIYIDTDFECLKSIPHNLLRYDFVSSIIFSFKPCIANGFMMAKPNCELIDNMIKNLKLPKKSTIILTIKYTGPGLLTKEYFKLKSSIRKNCLILPSNFFYPYPNFLLNSSIKPASMIENVSVGFHHWEMSWMKGNLIQRIYKKINKIFFKIIDLLKTNS